MDISQCGIFKFLFNWELTPMCQAVDSPVIFHVLLMTNPEPQVTVGTFPMVSVFWGQGRPGKLLFLVPVNCPQHRASLNIGRRGWYQQHTWRRAPQARHRTRSLRGTRPLQYSMHTEKSEGWKTKLIFLGITHPTNAGTTIQNPSSLPATPSFEFVSYVVSWLIF